ncbi:hypothetical protein ASE26_07405 [Duganella sp. Root198D2]|nr:hypothetical protein ASD07_23205 [Duganella sp. Root336D2]KRB87211.1 hypothetical protein ASE26_07405 [Duganella sp. Root198D2]
MADAGHVVQPAFLAAAAFHHNPVAGQHGFRPQSSWLRGQEAQPAIPPAVRLQVCSGHALAFRPIQVAIMECLGHGRGIRRRQRQVAVEGKVDLAAILVDVQGAVIDRAGTVLARRTLQDQGCCRLPEVLRSALGGAGGQVSGQQARQEGA